jgi:K+-sensing histidine kinase KdpD
VRYVARTFVFAAFALMRTHGISMLKFPGSGSLKKAIRMERIPGASRSASPIYRCGLAVVLVAAALGLTLLLQSVISTAGYLFLYTPVVASAWFGGKWSGWVAVILSVLAVEYFFTAPIYSFGLNRESLPIFIEFAPLSGSPWERYS